MSKVLQWMIENAPGMIANSVVENVFNTLLVYLVCILSFFYRGRLGIGFMKFIAVYFAVLACQAIVSLWILIAAHPVAALGTLDMVRILLVPLLLSVAAGWMLRKRAGKFAA